jgi:uncharacterized repeat protein (TIGR03803 family)
MNKKVRILSVAGLILGLGLVATEARGATTEKVLYSFCSRRHCTDGNFPFAGLVMDSTGNLYGTTVYGGKNTSGCTNESCGTAFELKRRYNGTWREIVLYSFCSLKYCADGNFPYGKFVSDGYGNLYGTTCCGGAGSLGTVFKLERNANGSWTHSVLYSFLFNNGDGRTPLAGVVFDANGNLYGTTLLGGAYGFGAVYKLSPGGNGEWTEQVLYSFLGANMGDGDGPIAELVFDSNGNLYGTTYKGGDLDVGVVFELSPSANGTWVETVLHSFTGVDGDGRDPQGSLVVDTSGNIYGTTWYGGYHNKCGGCGMVFELTPNDGFWNETIVHSFDGEDGANPVTNFVFDGEGNLYSTTNVGGADIRGTVFKMPPWKNGNGKRGVKLLHSFTGGADGEAPTAPIIIDAKGHLYGTSSSGGGNTGCGVTNGCGTIFEIIP